MSDSANPLITGSVPPSIVPSPVAPSPVVPPVHKPPATIPPPRGPITSYKPAPPPEPEGEDARMGFIDHLMELRRRLWWAIISVFVCVLAATYYYAEIFQFMRAPLAVLNEKYHKAEWAELLKQNNIAPGSDIVHLISTNPISTMIMVMWLGFVLGLVIASPIVGYNLWAFVSPGLHKHEKNAIQPVLYGGVGFFLTGAAIAYYLLFPYTIDFFVWLDLHLTIAPSYTVDDYMNLLMMMMIISGFICEIPLVVGVLAKLGLVEPAWLLKYWRICIFMSFVLGALISPSNDVMGMMVFSFLLLGVYITSILMAYVFYDKKKGKKA